MLTAFTCFSGEALASFATTFTTTNRILFTIILGLASRLSLEPTGKKPRRVAELNGSLIAWVPPRTGLRFRMVLFGLSLYIFAVAYGGKYSTVTVLFLAKNPGGT